MNPIGSRKVFLIVIGSIFALLCLIQLGVVSARQTKILQEYDAHLTRGILFHDTVVIPFVETLQAEASEQTELFKLLLKSDCVNASSLLRQDSLFIDKCAELGISIE